MKQWYANELSKLTHVSVRTLHHYDKIGLLKPSLRLSNNYRLYSETDLLKLQQIIALKFFGFELTQIKTLLAAPVDVLKHFSMQAQFLQEKSDTLREASTILKHITAECSNKKSIPWKKIIQLIEVYRMTQQLEKSWESKIFNPEELKQYAAFELDIKKRYSAKEKAEFEQAWAAVVAEVERNLATDPMSEVGRAIGERCMILINGFYGKENLNLRDKIWNEGFKKNQMSQEHVLSPKIVTWLDSAIDAYWYKRIYDVLSQVGSEPSSEILQCWNELLEDMYGDAQEGKDAVKTAAMTDNKVSQEAKNWLQTL